MTKPVNPFILVFALWACGIGAAGQFGKFAVIFREIAQVYPDAGQALGFLVSLISFLGIGLGLFAGLMVARIGARRMLVWALVLGGVLSLWQATLPALPWMLASRVIEGISHLAIVVAAPTMIGRIAPDAYRPAAMTLWSTFFGVSFTLMAVLGIPFVARYGVGSLFLVHATFMLVLAGLLLWMMPCPARHDAPIPALSFGDVVQRHIEIYRSPSLSAPALGWLFYTLTYVAFLTVLPGQVAPEDRAFVAGWMPLAGIFVSMTLGIVLLRVLPAVPVICLGFGVSGVILLALGLNPGNPYLCVALIGALGFVQGAGFACIPQLNPAPEAQAYANGAMAQMGNLGNTLGTPLMLMIMGVFGNAGMVGLGIFCYVSAIAIHMTLSARRRAAKRP